MGTKFKQPGDVLTHSPAGAVAVDAVVQMKDIVGIALVDIAAGGEGSVAIEGVFEVPKVAGVAWVQGDSLDWDASAAKFDKDVGIPAAGDVENCAVAFAAAASAATVGTVKLTPGTGTAFTA